LNMTNRFGQLTKKKIASAWKKDSNVTLPYLDFSSYQPRFLESGPPVSHRAETAKEPGFNDERQWK